MEKPSFSLNFRSFRSYIFIIITIFNNHENEACIVFRNYPMKQLKISAELQEHLGGLRPLKIFTPPVSSHHPFAPPSLDYTHLPPKRTKEKVYITRARSLLQPVVKQ